MFEIIEGDVAILTENGVFRQVALATLDGKLFAKAKGGFVRLTETGATSHPSVKIHQIVTDLPLYRDRFGRLCTAPGEDRKALAETPLLLAKD